MGARPKQNCPGAVLPRTSHEPGQANLAQSRLAQRPSDTTGSASDAFPRSNLVHRRHWDLLPGQKVSFVCGWSHLPQ